MVEQGTHKPLVVGSNPALATERRASLWERPLSLPGLTYSRRQRSLAPAESRALTGFLNIAASCGKGTFPNGRD
jgi:hypothetical protein